MIKLKLKLEINLLENDSAIFSKWFIDVETRANINRRLNRDISGMETSIRPA